MSKQEKGNRKHLKKKAKIALKYKLKIQDSNSYSYQKIYKLNDKLLEYIRKHFPKMSDADDETILDALDDTLTIFQDLCQNAILLIDVAAANNSAEDQSEHSMKVVSSLISNVESSLPRKDYTFYYDTLIGRLIESESFGKAIAKFVQDNARSAISKRKKRMSIIYGLWCPIETANRNDDSS